MYFEDEGDTPLEYGTCLGDLSSEVPPNHRIIEFCAGGPKNYGYKLENLETGEVTVPLRVRGFTLSYEASKELSYDSLKQMVFEFKQFAPDNRKIGIPATQVARTRDFRVTTTQCLKKYGVCYDKRLLQKDFSTLPFGYAALPPL